MRGAVLVAALGLTLAPFAAGAQDAAAPAPTAAATPAPAPVPTQYVYVALTTAEGTVVLALDKTHAPLTTANFLKYVDAKKMDGAVFYRAMHLDHDPSQGLLQGGIRSAATLFPPVAHEPTSKTGLSHVAGTVSMARFTPGSARSDFLILTSDMHALDAEPGNQGQDPGAGFAAFGHVVSGMDVVTKIWNAPLSPTAGDGVMKGQILAQPVKIITARRTSAPPAP